METTHLQQGNERSGRVFVLSAIALEAVVGAYFALGMPGMDHSGSAMVLVRAMSQGDASLGAGQCSPLPSASSRSQSFEPVIVELFGIADD